MNNILQTACTARIATCIAGREQRKRPDED
jgi:hypothetical protein